MRRRLEGVERHLHAADEDLDREAVIAAVRAASRESRREIGRLRSFRNILMVVATLMAIAAEERAPA